MAELAILNHDIDTLCRGIDPDALSALHPRWARDLASLGPFRREDRAGLGDVWVSNSARLAVDMIVSGECSSTMDLAWRLLELNALPDWAGVASPIQTSGRGQLRRRWISRPGNLHLSVLLPGQDGEGNGSPGGELGTLLPLVIGCGLVEFFQGAGIAAVMKWPNDILIPNAPGDRPESRDLRKVCGVLVEDRSGRTVVGVGVDIEFSPSDDRMRADGSHKATNLVVQGLDPTPLALASELVNCVRNWYERLLNLGSSLERILELEKRMAWKGREIIVEGTGRPFQGRIVGLNPDGGLVINGVDGREILYSGSIRLLDARGE